MLKLNYGASGLALTLGLLAAGTTLPTKSFAQAAPSAEPR